MGYSVALVLAALGAQATAGQAAADDDGLVVTAPDTAVTAALEEGDPAALINLGVASARSGDEETAQKLFMAVARSHDRFELETVSGEWRDSRVLARRGLAMLDDGTFERSSRVAVRR